METIAFAHAYAGARTRTLTDLAENAESAARNLRERAGSFPDLATALDADAAACDVYAAECRAAAADHTLPIPSGPNYPKR